MPRQPIFRKPHHSCKHDVKQDMVPLSECQQLQRDLQDLQDDCDDAKENLELARVSARTLEEQYRMEQRDVARLKAALAASEASGSEFEAHIMEARRERQREQAAAHELADAHELALAEASRARAEAAEECSAGASAVCAAGVARAEVSVLRDELSAVQEACGEARALQARLGDAEEAERQLRVASAEEGRRYDELRACLAAAEAAAAAEATAAAAQAEAVGGLQVELLEARSAVRSIASDCEPSKDQVQQLEMELEERDRIATLLRMRLDEATSDGEREARRLRLAEAEVTEHDAAAVELLERLRNVGAVHGISADRLLEAEREAQGCAGSAAEMRSSSTSEDDSHAERLQLLEDELMERDNFITGLQEILSGSSPASSSSRKLEHLDQESRQHDDLMLELRACMAEAMCESAEAAQRTGHLEAELRLRDAAMAELRERLLKVEAPAALGPSVESGRPPGQAASTVMGEAEPLPEQLHELVRVLEERDGELAKLRSQLDSVAKDAESFTGLVEHEVDEGQRERPLQLEEGVEELNSTFAELREQLAQAGDGEGSKPEERIHCLEIEVRERDAVVTELRGRLEEAMIASNGSAKQMQLLESEINERASSATDTPLSVRSLDRNERELAALEPGGLGGLQASCAEASSTLRALEQELFERDTVALELREQWEGVSTLELRLCREHLAAEHELQEMAGRLTETEAWVEALRGEAEAAIASDTTTAMELRSELQQERASHLATVHAVGTASAAQVRLSDELATLQAAIASDAEVSIELRSELEQERASHLAAAHAIASTTQAPGELGALQGLRAELDDEQQRRTRAEEALRRAREEAAELVEQLEDKEFALHITSEAAMEVGGNVGEPIGVCEARRLRAECLQLEAELHRSNSPSASSRSRPALPEDGPAVRACMTADFGKGGHEEATEAESHGLGCLLSTPSFALQDVAACAFAAADADGEDVSNPFTGCDGGDSPCSGNQRNAVNSSPQSRGASFAPPPRVARANGGAEGDDAALAAFDEADCASGNPFADSVHEADANPFEKDLETNPSGHDIDPNLCDADPVQPISSPNFGNKAGNAEEHLPTKTFGAQRESPSCLPQLQSGATPSFGEPPFFIQELAGLRARLLAEEAACAEAREEVLGARRALDEAHSNVQRMDDREDVARLRWALAEEAARSRRLGEHALRAEESRQRLLYELAQDATADADLAALAKIVGRAAKAIAIISKEAPLLTPDDSPPPSRPGTSAGPIALAWAAAAAAASEPLVPAPSSASSALSALPGPPKRLPGLPAPPPAVAAQVPPRPMLGRLPAAPRPEDLL